MDTTSKRNFICRLGFLALMGGILILWVKMGWPCLFRACTGIPCPGCGMSRAWLSALEFRLGDAFGYHPMFWSVPVLGILWLYPWKRFPKWTVAVCLAIAIGYVVCYVIRLWAFFEGAAAV